MALTLVFYFVAGFVSDSQILFFFFRDFQRLPQNLWIRVRQFKYKLCRSVIWYEALNENSPFKGPGGRGLYNHYLSLNILQEDPSCTDKPTIPPSNQ